MPATLPTEPRSLRARLLLVTVRLPGNQQADLGGDLLAALTVWALLVPEALAYASIAAIPPQYGLYCALAALLAYAIFDGSRHLIVGPTSTVAIVSASVVAPLSAGGDERYLALTITLVLVTGAILVAAVGTLATYVLGHSDDELTKDGRTTQKEAP